MMNWELFKAWALERGFETGAISWKETRKLIKTYKREHKKNYLMTLKV